MNRERLFDIALPACMLALMAIAAASAAVFSYGKPAAEVVTSRETVSEAEKKSEANEAAAAEEAPVSDVYVEVNIPATELTLYEGGCPLFRRKVAIGQGVYPTPEQESMLRRIEWNPWWYPPPNAPWAKGAKPTPPGPANPLGLVKMPLSNEIMFHGTNKDWSVGRPASHGCMRMHNRDVTELAWYLQERFSSKRDPSLREVYGKNRGTTYVVVLDTPVPVRLVYKPVVVRSGGITLYTDHYNRVASRKKAAILTSIMEAGYDIEGLDDSAVERLAKDWPIETEMSLKRLMRDGDTQSPVEAPECD